MTTRLHTATPEMLAALIGALLGISVSACGPPRGPDPRPDFVLLNQPPQKLRAKPAASVAVLDEAPAYAHVEVGLVEYLGDRDRDPSPARRAAAREALGARAAALGCDAVVVLGPFTWRYVIENADATTERDGLRGVCIVRR